MSATAHVYLNGRIVPYEQALVPVEDRGFLFADGVYEVVKQYRGRPFRFAQHLERLARSCGEIRLPLPNVDLPAVARELAERNGLGGADASIYIQITRGSAPRQHAFPQDVEPTVLVICRPVTPPAPTLVTAGAAAITVVDQRWGRCDIKSVGLLPNVLARQQAVEAGAAEAIFVRDGLAVEGSSSNLFAVFGGTLATHPATHQILNGITRMALLEWAPQIGIPVVERPIPLAELRAADEIFVSSTLMEVLPVTRLDGAAVGAGRPGAVALRLCEYIREAPLC